MEATTETETTTISSSPLPLQLNTNYCCAYLCNLCPRTSFHSMELLDQHMRDEHQGNENKLKMKENVKIEENNEKEQQIIQQPETVFDQSEVEQQQHLLNSSNLSTSPSSAFSIPPPNLTIINKLADLTCKKCPGGKTFTSREHLELHNTNTHRDRPQYCCNQCGALFSVKRELATHLRVHSGEQPHQCEKCGKEFGTRQLLKKHTMWHTGERSHVCPSCGKAFFQKGHLTQHLMIHKGGRPHKCSLCSKTFIFKFDLNRHLKIHTDRSFVCGRCSKCFQQEVELEGHVLNCKRSSTNIIRRNKRPSKRREPFFDNSTNIEENEIPLKKPSLTFKNEEESNNEQYNEFMRKNETNGGNDQVLNVSISSSPINSKPPTSSPIIYQPSPSINIHPIPHQQQQLPSLQQQQLNLNRLNYLLAIQKQQQQNKNLFSAFLNCNGIINNQNNEQLQQPIFSCNLCPQKFTNQSAYIYHRTLMHLKENKNEELIKIEENPSKPPPLPLPIFDNLNDLSKYPILQLLAADAYFSSASPQKTSPVICPSSSSSLCSSSASSACSSTTSTDFPSNSIISEQFNSSSSIQQHQQHFNFPPHNQFSSSFNCQNCLLEKQRLIEKERELVETRTELERIRSLFLRFGVMLGIKNEVLQQNKNLSGEERSNNSANISSIGGVNIPNQILLLNKNGAAN